MASFAKSALLFALLVIFFTSLELKFLKFAW